MIKPPGWCPHAVPSARGWRHPRTGELLKARALSEDQIKEWMDAQGAPAPAAEPAPVVEEVETDEPMDNFEDMSKLELEAIGREHGIELDRRKNKKTLISRLRGVVRR